MIRKVILRLGFLVLLIIFFVNYFPRTKNNDSTGIPDDFRNTPYQLKCERKSPTALSFNFYHDKYDAWTMLIMSRDNADIMMWLVMHGKKPDGDKWLKFGMLKNIWKAEAEMTPEDTATMNQKTTLTKEEADFLGRCMDKILEYHKEIFGPKKGTPVIFSKTPASLSRDVN